MYWHHSSEQIYIRTKNKTFPLKPDVFSLAIAKLATVSCLISLFDHHNRKRYPESLSFLSSRSPSLVLATSLNLDSSSLTTQ